MALPKMEGEKNVVPKSGDSKKKKCYVHNIFTINHMWIVIISSNLNLILRLFFQSNNNNLPLKICCKNIVKIVCIYHFLKKKKNWNGIVAMTLPK